MFVLDLFLRCVFVSKPSGQFSWIEGGALSVDICSSLTEDAPYIFPSCSEIPGLEDSPGVPDSGKAISIQDPDLRFQ